MSKKSAGKRKGKQSKINFYQFVFLMSMCVMAIFGAIKVGMEAGK